jgi:hypothetical protein
MFKKLQDFARLPQSQHPGQPAHFDHQFDVWQDRGQMVLFPVEGEPLKFPDLGTARAHALSFLSGSQPMTAPEMTEAPGSNTGSTQADSSSAST